jgi:hypothetical protein
MYESYAFGVTVALRNARKRTGFNSGRLSIKEESSAARRFVAAVGLLGTCRHLGLGEILSNALPPGRARP